jgi:hypothetical protein
MCVPQFAPANVDATLEAPGRRAMLTIRLANRNDRGTVRAAKLGVAATTVLVVLWALATDARTEPHLSVASPPSAPADQPAAPPPAAAPPNSGYQPGFIDAFGRFIGESAAKLDSQLKSTNETLGHLGSQTTDAAKGVARDIAKDAVGSAKEAAGALIGLPNARIVTGRERCVAAPNGAPDCRAAADTACRAKGFATGRSLDTQSTQNCPARIWLSGRPPQDGDCQLETYLTRAVCQ